MKFIFLIHCYPGTEGGAGLFSEIINGLKDNGHSVKVIASTRTSADDLINPNPPKKHEGTRIVNSINVKYLEVFARGRLFFRLGEKLIGASIFTCFKKGPVFRNFFTFFSRNDSDWVVTGLMPMANIFWGYLISRRNKSKLAVIPTYHETDPDYQNPFLLDIIKKANLVICLTKHEKDTLAHQGVSKNKMVVSGGIVNDSLLTYKNSSAGLFPKTPNILCLGIKSSHKQITTLIKAMNLLWKDGKKVTLTIAGPETLYSPEIEKELNNLKPEHRKNVTYFGEVSQRKKIDLIDRSTILVNPSAQESFGLVFIESWARKKPVIGSDISTLRDVINNNRNGLLFKPNSINDLAAKINQAISRPSLAKKMGENGYNEVLKKFTTAKVVRNLLKSFK